MNINLSSHSDTHHVTNCIHEHSVSNDKIGGMSFQSAVQQQNTKKEPQTLGEAISELAAIRREADSGHRIMGIGNSLGNSIGDVNGEGEDSIVMLMPDDTTDAKTSNNGHLQVSPDMLNTLVAPRKTDISVSDSLDSIKVNAMNGMSGFDTAPGGYLYKRRNRFLQTTVDGFKKRIAKWLHSLPEKLPGKEEKKEPVKKEMKIIDNKDYILDSYDRTGQYRQLGKTVTLNDNLNKKA